MVESVEAKFPIVPLRLAPETFLSEINRNG